jgi:hypothetical protein
MKISLLLALIGACACASTPAAEEPHREPFIFARGVSIDLATESGNVRISGDRLNLESPHSPLVLLGKVSVLQNLGFEATCDKAAFDPLTGEIVLQNRVRAAIALEEGRP